jgi:hypothetical protein
MRGRGCVTVGVLLLTLTACGGTAPDQRVVGPDAAAPTSDPTSTPAAMRSHAAAPTTPQALLDQRAAAVLGHDEEAFLAPVQRSDPAFFAGQRRLYLNLQRLPVSALSFSRGADGRVTRSLTLGRIGEPLDRGPVVGPAGFAVGGTPGKPLVVPAQDDPATDPWDLTSIQVAVGDDALVVTDAATSRRAQDLLVAVEDGISDVARAVPLDWSRTAVVYAFREPGVLASYASVPGGNLQHLGALSYPLRVPGDGTPVGSRIALLPGALDAGPQTVARIIRHELTHVAVGDHADDVPTWLSEGVAEYVAALPIPASRRRIATVAVERAEAGDVVLPDAATFNDDQQALHYAVAWMACDYLAATRGPAVLFRLMEAMTTAGAGRQGIGQDGILLSVTGLDSTELGQAAAKRIVRLFGTAPMAAPVVPTPMPTVPTAPPE